MTPSESPRDEAEHLRSLALTLSDVIASKPAELTPEQKTALWDLADRVQAELMRTPDRRADPQMMSRARSAARRKVLAGFGAALALIAVVSVEAYRFARSADTARLLNVVIAGNALRAAVVVAALVLLLRDMAARAKAEDELLRSRDAAMSAAEGRRVAQAEAEKLGERLHAVLDHIDTGVIMVEVDGTMSVFNVAAERILGGWREQIEQLNRAGTHPAMLEDEKTVVPPGDNPLARALKGQIVRDVHLFYRTPFRPKGYHLSVSAVPLRNPQGLLSGAVLMFSERGG